MDQAIVRGLQIEINGERICMAAVADGVLNAIVNIVDWRDSDALVQVGGLEGDEFLTWLTRELRVGDHVTVRIVETAACDEPVKRRPRADDMTNGRDSVNPAGG